MSSPAAPPPVLAASLILLRDRDGLEVLVGRRSDRVRAFPGATVFPGGKLERQDHDGEGVESTEAAAAWAALRETFEETGLFITADGQGPPANVDLAEARRAVEGGEQDFQALSRAWGRPLGAGRLTPYGRWVTPESMPYRFDTLFFVLEASPYEAAAELIGVEFETLGWSRPAEILSAEGVRLMPPTRRSLEPLAQARSAAGAVEAARRRGLLAQPDAQPFTAR